MRRSHGNLLEENKNKLSGLRKPAFDYPKYATRADIGVEEEIYSPYVLSPRQEDFIRTGESNDRSRIDRAILEKRDRLPNRIHNLIRDVLILSDSTYLEEPLDESKVSSQNTAGGFPDLLTKIDIADVSDLDVGDELKELARKGGDPETLAELVEQADSKSHFNELVEKKNIGNGSYESQYSSKDELWSELVDIVKYSQEFQTSDVFYRFFEVQPGDANDIDVEGLHLGFELGTAIRALQPDSRELGSNFDLIWGFVLAFIGEPPSEVREEQAAVEGLIEYINAQESKRQDAAKKQPTKEEITNMDSGSYEEAIKEAVRDAGITPHPIITREVKHHSPKIEDKENQRSASRQTLEKIAEKTPLRAVDTLRTRVEDDKQRVEERSVPGVEADEEIIERLWEQTLKNNIKSYIKNDLELPDQSGSERTEEKSIEEEVLNHLEEKRLVFDDVDFQKYFPVSSSSIPGDTLGSGSSTTDTSIDASVISRSLNRYTDSDEEDEDSHANYPIVQKKDAERGNEWKLTDYGMLLCYLSYHREETGWIYRYALGTEELSLQERKLITDALAEVDITN